MPSYSLRIQLEDDANLLLSAAYVDPSRYDFDRSSDGILYGVLNSNSLGDQTRLLRYEEEGAEPTGSLIQVQDIGSGNNSAIVSVLRDGDLAVVVSDGVYYGDGLTARIYAPDGTPRGESFDVAVSASGNGTPGHQVAALEGGGFAVTWFEFEFVGEYSQTVYGRIFAADGSAQGAAFEVEQTPIGGNAAGPQYPSVVGLADGGVFIAWNNFETESLSGRVYNADGSPRSDAFTLGTIPGGFLRDSEHFNPKLLQMPGGGAAVLWRDGESGISGQFLAADGALVGSSIKVSTQAFDANIAAAVTENGDILVVHRPSTAAAFAPLRLELVLVNIEGNIIEQSAIEPNVDYLDATDYSIPEFDLFAMPDGKFQLIFGGDNAYSDPDWDVDAVSGKVYSETLTLRNFEELTPEADSFIMISSSLAIDGMAGDDSITGSEEGVLSGELGCKGQGGDFASLHDQTQPISIFQDQSRHHPSCGDVVCPVPLVAPGCGEFSV